MPQNSAHWPKNSPGSSALNHIVLVLLHNINLSCQFGYPEAVYNVAGLQNHVHVPCPQARATRWRWKCQIRIVELPPPLMCGNGDREYVPIGALAVLKIVSTVGTAIMASTMAGAWSKPPPAWCCREFAWACRSLRRGGGT